MRAKHKEILLVYLFLAPSLAVFFLYRIMPLIWNIVLSFQKWQLFGPNEFVGFENYVTMWNDSVFWEAFKNTFVLLLAGPIAIVIALGLALLVNIKVRGRHFARTAIFLPYPLMPVAVGIIWTWLYNENVGLINYTLIKLGIVSQGIRFLASFNWSIPAIMFTSIWKFLGYYMIILLTGLQTIPTELYEATQIDGASKWNSFRYITLPLLKPTLFLSLIIAIINSFLLFDIIFVMTRGGPGHATEIFITYIYKSAFVQMRLTYGSTLTAVFFGILILITYTVNKISGEEAGAITSYG